MRPFFTISSFILILSVVAAAQEQPKKEAKPAVAVTADTEASAGEGKRFTLEKGEKDTAVSKGLKIEKKISGRLPAGYKSVVSAAQKEEIYEIQKDYLELIELLKVRIELLEKELDAKVDSLLDDEQKNTLRKDGYLKSEKKKKTK